MIQHPLFFDFSPDELLFRELVAFSCRPETDPTVILSSIHESAEAERIFEQAALFDLVPFLYPGLALVINALERSEGSHLHQGAEGIWAKKLRKVLIEATLINAELYQQTQEIIDEASRRSLDLILLKGVWLAEQVYNGSGPRTMCDIDVLVRNGQAHEFEQMLHEMGYKSACALSGKKCIHHEHHHLCPLVSANYVHCVEIPLQLTHPQAKAQLDIEGIWDRARLEPWRSRTVLSLDPTDLILYLALHSTYSHELHDHGLRDTCDIALVLARLSQSIDWDALEERATAASATKYLYLSLELARQICYAQIPSNVMARLLPSDWNQDILRAGLNRVFLRNNDLRISNNFSAVAAGYLSQETFMRLGSLFSRSVLAEIYGVPKESPAIYACIPKRLVNLISRYGSSALKLCSRASLVRQRAREMAKLDAWLA